MKHLLTALFVLTLILPSAYTQSAVIPGELLVMLHTGKDPAILANRLNEQHPGADFVRAYVVSERYNIQLFTFDENFITPESALRLMQEEEAVALAQFNHAVQQRLVPNDPSFASQQWSMNNTGQSGGTPDADIDAPEAWNITTGGVTAAGDTIVVAVIDAGFQLNHPDLQQNYFRNYQEIAGNGIDDDGNGYIDDVRGWDAYNNDGSVPSDNHGTHVAGIIGAQGNNNAGVAGVNWNVKILPIAGSSGSEATVVAAYAYAATMRELYDQTNGQKGAFVVSTNSSFGVDFGQAFNYPIWCAFYDTLGGLGILSAGAGPNANTNIDVQGDIPTTCPSLYMVAVTNTTRTDAKNTGAGYGIINMDIGAPGTSIYSTVTGSNYQNLTGTSMATPHVAGAIGLYYSAACSQFIADYKASPGPLALTMRNYLLTGVDSINSMANNVASQGRLNIHKGILNVQTYVCQVNAPPVANFNAPVTSGCPGLTVQFNSTTLGNTDSVAWLFPGGIPAASTALNPSVLYNALGQYNVQLIAYNGFGSDTLLLTNYIDINNTSITSIFSEDFEIQNLGVHGWTTVNQDNNNTWTLQTVQGNTPGTTAATVHIFNNQNLAGTVDGLISPILDLSSNTAVTLDFEHAHRRRVNTASDSLWISASTDGGNTWPHSLLRVAENGSGTFATGFILNQNFIPASSADWCFDAPTSAVCYALDLSQFDGEPQFRLKFEVRNGGGNNMYLDNIRINGICALPPVQPPVAGFTGNTQQVCEGESVSFSDQSQQNPVAWSWTFPGGTPAASSLQNPVVTYASAGTYDVSLVVTNSAGSDALTLVNYMQVAALPPAPVITENGGVLFSSYPTNNQWNDANGAIPGATGTSYTPVQGGFYTVSYTNSNGCEAVSAPYSYFLSTESNAANGISVYPNPVQQLVQISFALPGEFAVRVTDVAGKTVWQQTVSGTSAVLDFGDLPPGVYVLDISSAGQHVYRHRMVKL